MSDKTLYHYRPFGKLCRFAQWVTAVFTRRQINIESLNVSASSIKGTQIYHHCLDGQRDH